MVISKISAFNMRCLYKDTWDGYCCITVSTTIMENNEQIEELYGTHLGNRSDSDIKCLSLHYFLPFAQLLRATLARLNSACRPVPLSFASNCFN